MPWTWRYEKADGTAITADELQEAIFASQGDAESWLGENWRALLAAGVDQVSLLDTIQDPQAVDPAHEMDTTEMKDRLADAIARLPEREKLVVALYYYENLTLREIGEILGVTESRVCQIHGQITKKLRVELEADEALFSEVA